VFSIFGSLPLIRRPAERRNKLLSDFGILKQKKGKGNPHDFLLYSSKNDVPLALASKYQGLNQANANCCCGSNGDGANEIMFISFVAVAIASFASFGSSFR
ncbi:MAG: hypothetical protein WCG73_02745, partial [Candidatus Moraniibacteriota bacterium]